MRLWMCRVVVAVVFLMAGAILKMGFDKVTAEPGTTPPATAAPVISVATEIAEGCCVVEVRVTGAPRGTYTVVTTSGRSPAVADGPWTSDTPIQVAVGREWTGRVVVGAYDLEPDKQSELIGGPFGWERRTIDLDAEEVALPTNTPDGTASSADR